MIKYEEIVKHFIGNMVEDFSNVEVTVNEEGGNVTIGIFANNENISKLIGKKGRVANSLREIMGVVGKDNGKFIHVYFKDKDNDKDKAGNKDSNSAS